MRNTSKFLQIKVAQMVNRTNAYNWYKILIDFVTFKKLCCLSKLKPTLLRSMACQNNGCCSPSYRNLRWVSVYTWDDTPDPDHSDPEWSADHGCPDLPIFRSPFFRQLRSASIYVHIYGMSMTLFFHFCFCLYHHCVCVCLCVCVPVPACFLLFISCYLHRTELKVHLYVYIMNKIIFVVRKQYDL